MSVMTVEEFNAGPFVHLNDYLLIKKQLEELQQEAEYLRRKLKHVRRHNNNLHKTIHAGDRIIMKQRNDISELKAKNNQIRREKSTIVRALQAQLSNDDDVSRYINEGSQSEQSNNESDNGSIVNWSCAEM